ncbi:hypothetical protein AAC387_Pa03g3591 [Persea americana]
MDFSESMRIFSVFLLGPFTWDTHPATISSPYTSHAYYSDVCVGTITCCLEKKEGGTVCVYIMTLGVLAPYRGLGIGVRIRSHVLPDYL